MALQGRRLAVSIPDTLLEEKQSVRDKTAKLGTVARACAIYGVDLIEVFRDPRGQGEAATIRKVLEYLETPQYLRKALYPLDETLRFAGVLPPLRIPSHKRWAPLDKVQAGEIREGVVNQDGTVDVGLDVAPKLTRSAPAGRRVTVRVLSLKPALAELARRVDTGAYWGYAVEVRSLDEVFSDARFDVKVATSRRGAPMPGALGNLRALLKGAKGVKLVFGAPSRGLFEMVGPELGERASLVLDLFAGQQVETVRTEEALFAGLGLLNLLFAEKA